MSVNQKDILEWIDTYKWLLASTMYQSTTIVVSHATRRMLVTTNDHMVVPNNHVVAPNDHVVVPNDHVVLVKKHPAL